MDAQMALQNFATPTYCFQPRTSGRSAAVVPSQIAKRLFALENGGYAVIIAAGR